MYKWIRENQYTDYDLIQIDEIFDPAEKGIHPDIIANWERDGWIEKVKPTKPKREVKKNVRHRKTPK